MSIATEITRLQNAKASIKTSIENKGVTVPSATKLDGYSTLIDSIPTGSQITVEPLSVTQNGTYQETGKAYSPVTVNVQGGGSSGWTKVAETTYDVSTTSTSATTVATWATGHSEIWTPDKILYIRVRDTAGKRNVHFYGSDNFFMNMVLKNSPSTNNTGNYTIRMSWSVTSDGTYNGRYGYTTTGYGVYPMDYTKDGIIEISARYNSTYSRTIDGTYKVEVYLLDPAGGVPIFN